MMNEGMDPKEGGQKGPEDRGEEIMSLPEAEAIKGQESGGGWMTMISLVLRFQSLKV